MRVHLRSGEACVSQHFFHSVEIGTRIQQVGGKRMAERVRTPGGAGGGPEMAPNNVLDAAGAQGRSRSGQENLIAVLGRR